MTICVRVYHFEIRLIFISAIGRQHLNTFPIADRGEISKQRQREITSTDNQKCKYYDVEDTVPKVVSGFIFRGARFPVLRLSGPIEMYGTSLHKYLHYGNDGAQNSYMFCLCQILWFFSHRQTISFVRFSTVCHWINKTSQLRITASGLGFRLHSSAK